MYRGPRTSWPRSLFIGSTTAGTGNDLAGSILRLAEMIARRGARAPDDDSTLDYAALIDAIVTQVEAGRLL